jgi:hypothetical protein
MVEVARQAGESAEAPECVIFSCRRSSVRVSDEMISAGASVALESWGLVSTAYLVEQVFLAMLERME